MRPRLRLFPVLGALSVLGLFGLYGLSPGCDSAAPDGDGLGEVMEAQGSACGDRTCTAGQRCTLKCEGGATAPTCEADPGVGRAIGEACDGENPCRTGLCLDGLGSSAIRQCVAFCATDAACGPGRACVTTSLSYWCGASGQAPVKVRICRNK